MDLKEVKSKKLFKEYSLIVPYEDFDKEINHKIETILPNVSLPGFRKGKAPLNIVKKKYEESVFNEVIQSLINLKTADIIKEKKFDLFRQPKIDLKKFEKNQPLEFELKFDLQPEIKLQDFKKIKLTKYEIKFSKKDLDDQYKLFISNKKNFSRIKKNRFAKKGDKITINFKTDNEDVPEYLRYQNNLPIDTNLEQEILPNLNKEILSKLKEGDTKKINIDLSVLLKNEKLKKIIYDISIISIEEKIKFEVTREYLEQNGFKSEEDLKEVLKNNTIRQYDQGVKEIEKKQLMDFLNKTYKFDLPEGVLEEDFEEIWKRLENAKKNNNMDADDKVLSDDDLKNRYKKISERRVRLAVLLQFIAKEFKITISQEELNLGIKQYASQYPGQEKGILEYINKNPNSIESIRGPLLEQKIIDNIISKADITKKSINDEQYKKLEQETFDIKRDKL